MAGRKAAAAGGMEALSPQDLNFLQHLLAEIPKLTVVSALASLAEAGI
jgi:hypothetical protein